MNTINKVVVSIAATVALLAASAVVFANSKSNDRTEALTDLRKDNSLGIGVWKRDALTILGELPQASKRLSVEEAERIVSKEKDIKSMTITFNEVAGAPDWEGGSGIERLIYYTDDSRKEAIVVMLGKVLHVIEDENGKQQIRYLFPIDQQAAPQPTSAPST
ncbi:hypothetical protein [Cohnella sp. 56]|uniref:hypothetical protein n=1 Tax=Cohnella sp. 56 TaxID=3113722 RepID=UPI0030E9CA0A